MKQVDRQFPDVSADALFHTAGIGAILPWLEKVRVAGVTRVIAFSSTSLLTKEDSGSAVDREMVARLASYEKIFIETSERLGLRWTILRPTMIYGGKFGDRTVMDIARVIRKFGFFPLFGGGRGLRQPVHAADLAAACMQVVDCPVTFNRIYNLGGGERLPYRSMVERIFNAMDRKPRFLPVPLAGFELAVRFANLHPRYRHLTSSMATRMSQDMVFSIEEAHADFGFAPRSFLPSI
ncbi:NAD-dependent epimerase/dehydratase family protein [Nitrobacter sp.]|uniref:NAD-dependent epimerase/dehydratase family protein n=1 Tax=Nitrobacter sp. TaxID=29420 RepID=UPI0029CAC5BC|nr:NAD-dependent epimerase/dehydratase family protein [Nitrobacter sp.]